MIKKYKGEVETERTQGDLDIQGEICDFVNEVD